LSNHQRTTKRCIRLRTDIDTADISKSLYQCKHCKKELTSKFRFDNHIKICKNKLKNEKDLDLTIIKKEKQESEIELKIKIKQLEERVKELQSNTINNTKNINKNKTINKTINNTNITIYEVMTPESVREFFKTHYNLETLLGGQKALAQFICDGFIREKQVYQCTDRSRQKFVIENKDGTQMEDANCDQLIGLTAPGLPHVKDVYEDALFSTLENVTEDDIQDNYLKISNIDKDRTEFNKELSKIAPSCSPKPVNTAYEDALIQLKAMRDAIIPRETKVNAEPDAIPVLLEIGGISLGQLDIYRQGYRKRFEKDGEDAEIKAPRALAERFATEPDLKHEYMEWIKS
jgi:hypothetical protein